jgi:hypothetical protein
MPSETESLTRIPSAMQNEERLRGSTELSLITSPQSSPDSPACTLVSPSLPVPSPSMTPVRPVQTPYLIASLNCSKQKVTTQAAITTHALNPQCLIICLQEPALLPDGYPPTDPAFTRHFPSHKPNVLLTFENYHASAPQSTTAMKMLLLGAKYR